MQNLFIGVDGGGTKTEAIVQNEAGEIIGQGQAGAGNIKTSAQDSFNSVNTAIEIALHGAGIFNKDDHKLHVGLGMAGTEVPEAVRTFLNIPHSFTSLVLNSDAYAACLGVHAGEDGAIIIIGTGVIGFQICQNTVERVGGYGFPHSDEGGGAWIGLEVLRATFHAYDGRLPWSPLLKSVFEHFNQNIDAMVSFANLAQPLDFGKFAPIVMKYLEEQESFAINLIEQAADKINQVAHALFLKSKTTLPCCLIGGIAPFIEPFLLPELRSCLVQRKMSAPYGAILMLKKQMGLIS